MSDLDDEELRATRKLNGVEWEEDKQIQVGDYVRLKEGQIFKIDENTTNYYNSNKEYITNEITKHSPNLIDLIEVGDYVNGERVLCFKDKYNCDYDIGTEYSDDFGEYFGIDKEDIKSIVTKEQFNSVMYKVKE